MIHERDINLAFGRGGVDVTSQRASNWSTQFDPESSAAGGNAFSYHRNHIRPSYVQDCLPTENGYVSTAWKPYAGCADVMAQALELSLDVGCDTEPCIRAYNNRYIDWTKGRTSTKYLSCKGRVLVHTGKEAGSFELEGLDAMCALGLVEFNGRLIVYTDSELYLESAVNKYSFVPALTDQAMAFGVKYHIGKIVRVVHAGEYLYVLGSSGGVVGKCVGDSEMPMHFQYLQDFEGISFKHNVDVQYQAATLYAWSKGGLGSFNSGQWTPIESDLSWILSKPVTVELTPKDIKYPHPNDRTEDKYQTRDTLEDCLHYPLFVEAGIERYSNDVAVYTLSPKTYAISYAEKDGAWSRLLYVDTVLGRSSVLHVDHRAVYRDVTHSKLLILSPEGAVLELVREQGTGFILFANNFRSSGKVIKLPRVSLHGRFNTDVYQEHKVGEAACYDPVPDVTDPYARIWCSVGMDINDTNNTRDLKRVLTDPHVLHYTGMVIGNYMSMLIPFSGFINTIKVQRA